MGRVCHPCPRTVLLPMSPTVHNQLGVIGGASAGGLVLALGGFSLVGVFCLGSAMAAAVVVIGLRVRSAQAFRIRVEGT